ncbi:MAG: alpha-E domain-containing protein [Pseudomonadales bacterium]
MTAHTLSSTAERAYWLGRYLERAETTARLIVVHGNLIMDLPRRLRDGWRPIIDITGSSADFGLRFEGHAERQVCRYLISDGQNPGSLLSSLAWARENARTLRGIIPKSAFEYVNEMHIEAREMFAEPLSRSRRVDGLGRIAEYVQRVDGFMSANMMHDAHWRFLRMGQFLERADMTTRVIDVAADAVWQNELGLDLFSDVQWRSVLRSLYAHHSYNTSVGEPITAAPVIEFLLKHRGLPRAVAYGLNSLRNNLRDLPQNDTPLGVVDALLQHIESTDVRSLPGTSLSGFLDDCQQQISVLHNTIHARYFDFQAH